jgi:hypothetical protein
VVVVVKLAGRVEVGRRGGAGVGLLEDLGVGVVRAVLRDALAEVVEQAHPAEADHLG